jgi:hypothetical protein
MIFPQWRIRWRPRMMGAWQIEPFMSQLSSFDISFAHAVAPLIHEARLELTGREAAEA